MVRRTFPFPVSNFAAPVPYTPLPIGGSISSMYKGVEKPTAICLEPRLASERAFISRFEAHAEKME